jgi:hypothetical protein
MPLSLTRTLGHPPIKVGNFLSTWTAGRYNNDPTGSRVNLHALNIDASSKHSLCSSRDIGFFKRARAAHLDRYI